MATDSASLDTASGKNKNAENFPVGSFLIRSDLRPHIHAFYDFARDADDVADHPLLSAPEKISQLEKFAISLLDAKNDAIPSAVALRKSLRETGVSPQHSLDLLTAFKRDALQRRYRDWYDLIDYCNFSAAPVGRHVLELHGIGKKAWRANDSLCNALQIINHVQDCGDDYRELDRVYLPQDILSIRGARIEDLSQAKLGPPLRASLDEILNRVEPMLKDARTLPREIPDFRLKAETSIICALAERLVALLRKRDPLCDNVKLGKCSIFCATLTGMLRTLE
ncbi:MAG: squalene synthase HpnC [Alphaproteobacteria bacterium]|nr:squalene synthase HpnC [Alphaproteobacteria bacterium]